jgi:hypothetical protein
MSNHLRREENMVVVNFNAASMKACFNGKGTGLCSDALCAQSGKPLVNNSQKHVLTTILHVFCAWKIWNVVENPLPDKEACFGSQERLLLLVFVHHFLVRGHYVSRVVRISESKEGSTDDQHSTFFRHFAFYKY